MQTPINTNFHDFITHLQILTNDPPAATSYANSYLAAHAGNFPIVEGNTAHFVRRERPGTITGVGGDWNGFDGRNALMMPVGGGLLHYQHDFELDARLDYLFFETDATNLNDLLSGPQAITRTTIHSILDPLNSRTSESGFGLRSELAMPNYHRPAFTERQPGISTGVLSQKVISSKVLDQERPYTVYMPPNYDVSHQSYPAIYFQDGGDYLRMGKAPIILDNLIAAGTIPPVAAIFVPPVEREQEYNCADQYVRFFCDELVPEMQRKYNLSADPAKRAVVGPSLGGLISLYIGKQRPDALGLVGAQSSVVSSVNGKGTFDARVSYAVDPCLPVRLHLIIGTYEDCFGTDNQGRCRDLLNPVREVHSVLEQLGYLYRYVELHQGHSWGLWRDTLVDLLVYFYGDNKDI